MRPIRADGAVLFTRESWSKSVRRELSERLRTIPGLEAIADDDPLAFGVAEISVRLDKTMVDLDFWPEGRHWCHLDGARGGSALIGTCAELALSQVTLSCCQCMRLTDHLRRLFLQGI